MSMYITTDEELLTMLQDWSASNPHILTEYNIPLKMHEGELNPFYGHKHTEESKAKISQSKIGVSVGKGTHRPWATDNLKFIKCRAYGEYEIVDPVGNTSIVINLKKFCSEKSLSYSSMSSLANGNLVADNHRGYKCRKLRYVRIHPQLPKDFSVV